MNKDSDLIWKAKLAAWTHDPAEKALVLLRDPSGHEKGTVAELRRKIFGQEELPTDILSVIETADRWAAAADRPQFPREAGEGPYAQWAQVRFDQSPVLIHPLSGEKYDLSRLTGIDAEEVKAISLNHFSKFVQQNEHGDIEYRKTFLRFWREGPEPPSRALGHLWRLLPADTRVPDHSIWEHLNLVSGLAGAMMADPDRHPALLKISIGPVQSFIAQARSTSDLWAGSHLLSRLIWSGLEALCDKFGPDCVLFPDLHGVPLVDAWLDAQGIGFEFPHRAATDENPLFAAALPNVFLAIVPSSEAEALAQEMGDSMRKWIMGRAECAARRLVEAAGLGEIPEEMRQQLDTQLAGFPEIYWCAVPWNIAGSGDDADARCLAGALGRFYPPGTDKPGFLSNPAWKLLSQEITVGGVHFYRPNPGVLYPALYDLLDRCAGAAKACRPFDQAKQEGYRCSLCGEREWLTGDRHQLALPRGQRKNSIWARLKQAKPSWAKKGEHLCALCTLKRLWPEIFKEEARKYVGQDVDRFTVSTHTMALSATLESIIDQVRLPSAEKRSNLKDLVELVSTPELEGQRAALPSKVYRKLLDTSRRGEALYKVVTRLPLAFDQAADAEDEVEPGDESRTLRKISLMARDFCGRKPETYYALILMDGDRMGAWVSGTNERLLLPYCDTWHPQISNAVAAEMPQCAQLIEYLNALRPTSPARHVAISRCLNGFAINLARLVVEEAHSGKLIYAGGDDLLAMVSVRELLDVLLDLRCAFSGLERVIDIDGQASLRLGNGHALLKRRGETSLYRLMGLKATTSVGAVVAHYSAPLGAVLRELRRAEHAAKNEGGRDAFAITLMKRAGGRTTFVSKWLMSDDGGSAREDSAIRLLQELRTAFAQHLSRQAAYQTLEWLELLSDDGPLEQAKALLARQFRQHPDKHRNQSLENLDTDMLAAKLAAYAADAGRGKPVAFLRQAINLAEFLAREGRA